MLTFDVYCSLYSQKGECFSILGFAQNQKTLFTTSEVSRKNKKLEKGTPQYKTHFYSILGKKWHLY
jgi:hypothetical protein